MANDGKVILETGLDTTGIEKDLKKVGSTVEKDLGQNITKTMDKAETSITILISTRNFGNIRATLVLFGENSGAKCTTIPGQSVPNVKRWICNSNIV